VKKGRLVIATVQGDIHDIGKNIVKTVLENYGYETLDLGRDVAPEVILETVEREKLPLVGLSALMTTTLPAMEATIRLLRTLPKPPVIFVGGAVVQWLRDGLKIISSADESEALASKVDGNGGVYVVPAFTGLGAPWWDGAARGTITGITRGTSRGHIVRAGLESIAYQVADVVQAMEKDAGIKITRLAVDGGASKNEFLLQFQSDILNCPLVRPEVVETTALGAAYLAGLACGFWKDEGEIRATARCYKVFSPNMPEATRVKLLSGWEKAVAKARD